MDDGSLRERFGTGERAVSGDGEVVFTESLVVTGASLHFGGKDLACADFRRNEEEDGLSMGIDYRGRPAPRGRDGFFPGLDAFSAMVADDWQILAHQ
jgi:hypothetical protein